MFLPFYTTKSELVMEKTAAKSSIIGGDTVSNEVEDEYQVPDGGAKAWLSLLGQ